ncbi:MAG: class I SAM-dependent methyltransferase [Betaproteobacteria bacterium]
MLNATTIYDDDLAYIHDVGFSGLSESWAPGLLELLRDAGIKDGTIIDIGCGGGGWVEHLVKVDYRAVGVDVSPAMIDLARKRVPSANFQVNSIWDYTIPRCRAVTALSEVVCYRTESCADPNLETLFGHVFDSLESGGLFIFDVTEIGLDRDRDREFAEGEDWACLVRYEHEEEQDRLHRHITSFRKMGALFRRSHEQHVVQLYDGDIVAEMLERAGFQVRRVRCFGSAPLLPMRLGFIARKSDDQQ